MRIQALAAALLLLLLAAVGIDAQGTRRAPATKLSEPVSTQTAITNDGRTVVLKSDGTWQFQIEPPRAAPTPSGDLVTLDINATQIPVNFSGHDTRLLFNKLVDLKKQLEKGEFETTVEYNARVEQQKQNFSFAGVGIFGKFFLVVPTLQAAYDADSHKMAFWLPVKKDRPTDFSDSRIELESGEILFNDTPRLPLSGETFNHYFSAEISLNVENAKRLKDTARAILVVQFEEPYIAEGSFRRGFQVRLIDVFFFDPQTGKILAKMSQVGK